MEWIPDGASRHFSFRAATQHGIPHLGGLTLESLLEAIDLSEAICTAVINKRAGEMRRILGRKAVKHAMSEDVTLINAAQDVYLDKKMTLT